MVRNTNMTLRHQLYTAARLLANEQAVNRVFRRQLEYYQDNLGISYSLHPTVIVDEGRINQASELIERTAEL